MDWDIGLLMGLLLLGVFLVVVALCAWDGFLGTALISLSGYIGLGGFGMMFVAGVIGLVMLFFYKD